MKKLSVSPYTKETLHLPFNQNMIYMGHTQDPLASDWIYNGVTPNTAFTQTLNHVIINAPLDITSLTINAFSLDGVFFLKKLTNLTTLDLFNNAITAIRNTPSSLTYFNCGKNQIDKIPKLKTGLLTFICQQCFNVRELPPLPNTLVTLDCSNGVPLLSLPTLPNSLQILNCAVNDLPVLPTLPPSLITLTCSQTKIIAIPDSSGTQLTTISCNTNTQLTSIGPLSPHLITLTCHHTNLTSLPTLPATLTTLTANFCILTAAAVNTILATLVANGLTGGSVNVNSGGNSAPTGQGLTDKATLQSRGWTVSTK